MKWKKYTIHTTTEAEDLVSLMLNENGVEGVQIENNVPLSETDTKGMFIDILPELGEDDGTSRVSFFLHLAEEDRGAADTQERVSENGSADSNGTAADLSYTIADRLWTEEEIAALLEQVKTGLEEMSSYADIGEGRIEESSTEDTDWRNQWKQYFKPIRSGAFLIKPTWEDIPAELAEEAAAGALKVIEIDPGTAFGTGSHETTRLCMSAIEKYVKGGERVLDIGTGSGILGIAALRCGASAVTATELDEMCAPSIRDNVAANRIAESRFRLIIGNILGDGAVKTAVRAGAPDGYGLITANILAPVIVMLAAAGEADAFCKKSGIFITSGIIDTRLEEVEAAFAANPAWKVLETVRLGEWCSVVAERI